MTHDEAKQLVIKSLTDIQVESGHPMIPIDGKTCPLKNLPDFDSNNGIEFTCHIEKAIACEIPLDENLCFDDDNDTPRTVDQIVDRIVKILNLNGKLTQ